MALAMAKPGGTPPGIPQTVNGQYTGAIAPGTVVPNGQGGAAPYIPYHQFASPTMFQDPNTRNEYQWNPVNNRYDLFSNGVDPGQRALDFLQKASGLFGAGSGSGASGAAAPASVAAPPQIPHVVLDTNAINAADRAAFARAKDTTGQITTGALKALRDEMAGRNILGSSIDANAEASVINQGAKNLAEVPREQAIQAGQRAVDLAKTSYSGDINQRGQDVTMRGQDIGAQEESARAAAAAQQAAQQRQLDIFRLLLTGAGSIY